MTLETKKSAKNKKRSSLGYWCDANSDADSGDGKGQIFESQGILYIKNKILSNAKLLSIDNKLCITYSNKL